MSNEKKIAVYGASGDSGKFVAKDLKKTRFTRDFGSPQSAEKVKDLGAGFSAI